MRTPTSTIRNIQVVVSVTLAATLAAVRPFLLSELPAWVTLPAIVLLSILATYGLGYLLDNFLSDFSEFRKFIFRRNYIEGYWWDVSTIDGNEIIAIICIEHPENEFKVHGSQYTLDGQLQSRWTSDIVRFDEQVLKYFYNAEYYFASDVPKGYGIAEFQFKRPTVSSAPSGYIGYYQDFQPSLEPQRIFQGWRMTEAQATEYAEGSFLSVLPKLTSKRSPERSDVRVSFFSRRGSRDRTSS
jgi:hypothetical protein